jgi:hypothetical protein
MTKLKERKNNDHINARLPYTHTLEIWLIYCDKQMKYFIVNRDLKSHSFFSSSCVQWNVDNPIRLMTIQLSAQIENKIRGKWNFLRSGKRQSSWY